MESADIMRKKFYETLLHQPSHRPETDFELICKAWLDATHGQWVWLWLFNPYTNEWEIRHVACKSGSVSGFILPTLTSPNNLSVTEYATLKQTPQRISDLDWRCTYNGEVYSVACKRELAAMGCKEFLTVPFKSAAPSIRNSAEVEPAPIRPAVFHGAICVHFRNDSVPIEHPDDSLMLMGALTANAIVSSFQKSRFDALVKLNDYAEEVLAQVARDITSLRSEYLRAVVKLIQDFVRVGAVSIFYHDRFYKQIYCLYSTGLCNNQGALVPQSDLPNVTYASGFGRTGECFLSGATQVFSKDDAKAHQWTYSEMLEGVQVGGGGAVICPIPIPRSVLDCRMDKNAPRAHGVIRCSKREVMRGVQLERPFDPITVQTLEFIARQVGPVLETLDVRLLREHTISVVKHDLYAPMAMIRNTARRIAVAAEKSITDDKAIKLRKYDVENLESAALLADTHVAELDLNPGIASGLHLTMVSLNAVISRIKNLLQHVAFRDNDMRIAFAGFDAIPKLWVDAAKIERVFVNILMNAIKYGLTSSTITVRAYVAHGGFKIEFRNEGLGVSESEVNEIFQLGYRSPRVVNTKQGVGLGLYIAQGIVDAHFGSISVTSCRNPTEFSVWLPGELKYENWQTFKKRAK